MQLKLVPENLESICKLLKLITVMALDALLFAPKDSVPWSIVAFNTSRDASVFTVLLSAPDAVRFVEPKSQAVMFTVQVPLVIIYPSVKVQVAVLVLPLAALSPQLLLTTL